MGNMWPMQQYQQQPPGMASPFAYQPSYGSYQGPRYSGPFNFGPNSGGLGMMAQLAAPFLLQQFAGKDFVPLQFSPQQSAYDQLLANQMYRNQMGPMPFSQRQGQQHFQSVLNNITKSTQAGPMTQVQQARNTELAGNIQSMMPIATQLLGPEMVDQFYGSAGSPTIMSQQFQQAFRTRMDPISGRSGTSARSNDVIASEVYAQLYGKGANIQAMKGIGAGEAGAMMNELQMRGLGGPAFGTQSISDRIAAMPKTMQADQIARLAENAPTQAGGKSLSEMRDAGEKITTAMVESARKQIENTLKTMNNGPPAISNKELSSIVGSTKDDVLTAARKNLAGGLNDTQRKQFEEAIAIDDKGTTLGSLRTSGKEITAAQQGTAANKVRALEGRAKNEWTVSAIEDLPGGADILRAGDADKVKNRLKDMAGAVSAMKEIFGDAGHPDAPMAQIINGLNELTQGGLYTMNPQNLERIVRRTQSIANQTGVSAEAQMAMAQSLSPLADRLGVNRALNVDAAQYGVLYGRAAMDTQQMSRPVWGQQDPETLRERAMQLRVHNNASPMANQLGALSRLVGQGLIKPEAGSRLEAMTKAINEGNLDYTFKGKRQTLAMDRNDMVEILMKEGKMSRTDAMTAVMDRYANQEYIKNNEQIGNMTAIQSGREIADHRLSGILQNRYSQQGTDAGEKGALADKGMWRSVSRLVARDFFNLNADQMKDAKTTQLAMGERFKARLREQLKATNPKATDAQIDAMVEEGVKNRGGLQQIGATTLSGITLGTGQAYGGNYMGMWQTFNSDTQKQLRKLGPSIEAEGLTRDALGGLQQASPIRRIMDALKDEKTPISTEALVKKISGGIDFADLEKRDPSGQVSVLLGRMKDSAALDPTKKTDMAKIRENAMVMKGLISGGEAAQQVLDNKELVAKMPEAQVEMMRKAAKGESTVMDTIKKVGVIDTTKATKVPEAAAAGGASAVPGAVNSAKAAASATGTQSPIANAVAEAKETVLRIIGKLTENADGSYDLDGSGKMAASLLSQGK